ncbi:MAG: transporter [Devosia sp.]|jgi:DHA2 family lincomycin resistance protein-like MFS transporter|nr:transporter [Devosia sp.]
MTETATAAAPPAAASDRLTPGSAIAITVLIVSTFTVILNEMLMAVALPRLMADLDITAATAQWLTTGYMLTMAVVMPVTGFLTQRFQMRTVFLIAMVLFLFGTLIAAAAPDFPVLMFGRVIQAVGTAIITPLAFTAVTTLAPPSRTGRMMALLTISTSIAPSIGPIVAGSILSIASWRWLFILILPIAIVCLLVGRRVIRVPSDRREAKLDLVSLALSTLGFSSLVYGLGSFGEGGGEHALIHPGVALTAGVVIVGLFVGRQLQLQKTDSAQLDMRPFAVKTFSAAILAGVLFMTPAFGLTTVMPFVLQTSYGLNALEAGLFMAPSGLVIIAVSALVGRLYDQVGPRVLMLAGAAIDALAFWNLSNQGPGTPIAVLLASFLVVFLGQALIWTPVFSAALGSINKHLLPHGSAILNTLQQLAGAAGIAIMFSMMGVVSSYRMAEGDAEGAAIAQGAQQAFQIGSIMVLVSLLVVFFFIPKKVGSSRAPVAVH